MAVSKKVTGKEPSHQCLSAGSPLGTQGFEGWLQDRTTPVTNAFRQGVHWGPCRKNGKGRTSPLQSPMPFGRESTGDPKGVGRPLCGHVQSPMPFGRESTGDTVPPKNTPGPRFTVTNAFRQGVHWGPAHWLGILSKHPDGSPMPFGRESTGDPDQPVMTLKYDSLCHQCLSAGSPLGTR